MKNNLRNIPMNTPVTLETLETLVNKTKVTLGLTILVTNEGIRDLLVLNQGRIIALPFDALAGVVERLGVDRIDPFTNRHYMTIDIKNLIECDGMDVTYDYVGEYRL
jgi:hypothetical protein